MLFDDINNCQFSGRIRDEPILEETTNKNNRWKLSYILAINSKFKSGGAIVNNVVFIQCQHLFKTKPSMILNYLKKGNRISVQCRLNSFKPKNGEVPRFFYNVSEFLVLEITKENQIDNESKKSIQKQKETFSSVETLYNDMES